MFAASLIDNPIENEATIRRWRRARIVMRAGKLLHVQRRHAFSRVSVAQVWLQGKFARPSGDVCQVDYYQPLGMKGVLTLDYVLSGDAASFQTCLGAAHVLDSIARIRGSLAIVAHVSNASISDRMMLRLGWQRHMESHPGRHWIRRFYDGYPECQLHRYL